MQQLEHVKWDSVRLTNVTIVIITYFLSFNFLTGRGLYHMMVLWIPSTAKLSYWLENDSPILEFIHVLCVLPVS